MTDPRRDGAGPHPDPVHAQDQARRQAIQVEIGHRLRQVRQRQGLSLRDVAERVGLSIQQVGKYETGLSSPYISILHAMARALGTTVPDLLEGIAPSDAEPAPWATALLRVGDTDALERMALMDMFDRIPDSTLRRLILRMVVHLAETSQAATAAAEPALAED